MEALGLTDKDDRSEAQKVPSLNSITFSFCTFLFKTLCCTNSEAATQFHRHLRTKF